MTVERTPDISELLVAWGNGDEEALRRLMPVVYPEIQRIAWQHLGPRPRNALWTPPPWRMRRI